MASKLLGALLLVAVAFSGDAHPHRPAARPGNWVTVKANELLESRAVEAGVFTDNLPTYVARVWHEGNILPGIARPNVGAWASWNGHEVKKETFEVLISDNVTWVPAANGEVPDGARPTGLYANGTALYSCRVLDDGAFIMESGLLQKGSTCSIPWLNQEAVYSMYEVLVWAEARMNKRMMPARGPKHSGTA